MKNRVVVSALLVALCMAGTLQAGIFGHRRQPSAQLSQPASRVYKSPAQSRNPWDWHEAHRGYGIKIRGW
jgi:hypothetical protein